MTSLVRIWALGTNTVREAVRNKILYTLLFFAIVMIATGVLVSMLSYVEGERILQDVGLASIRVFGVGMAIFLGIGLISKEVDRRTIYTILSKPVSRAEFLLGKYLGLVLTLWLQLGIMSVAFFLVSTLAGAPFDLGHVAALALVGFELMVMVAVATLFSVFATPLLASLYSAGIYCVGHVTRDLVELGARSGLDNVGTVTAVIHRLFPDLEMFNLSIQAVNGLPIPAAEIWWPVAYGVLYTGSLLAVAAMIFERRDFR
ncbi:MAG: ABC transporter permease [Proteobacteria bacterium]|nr:ABC transporter permease [Pseudomonadota bacterium]